MKYAGKGRQQEATAEGLMELHMQFATQCGKCGFIQMTRQQE